MPAKYSGKMYMLQSFSSWNIASFALKNSKLLLESFSSLRVTNSCNINDKNPQLLEPMLEPVNAQFMSSCTSIYSAVKKITYINIVEYLSYYVSY